MLPSMNQVNINKNVPMQPEKASPQGNGGMMPNNMPLPSMSNMMQPPMQ